MSSIIGEQSRFHSGEGRKVWVISISRYKAVLTGQCQGSGPVNIDKQSRDLHCIDTDDKKDNLFTNKLISYFK